MGNEEKLTILGRYLSPENPIRTTEFLRGRTKELDDLVQELTHFHGIPFIYGNRGVGKTSLARTAAQQVTKSDREHIYIACAPGSQMLTILREVATLLLGMAVRLSDYREISKKVEVSISANPSIKVSVESKTPKLDPFPDINAAVRTLHEIDALLPDARATVVIIDELEELREDDRRDLAYLVKQLGDQEFQTRFVLVGIAANVHELIGTHESVPRYLHEVSLEPLLPQSLMDIVTDAAEKLDIEVDREVLYRIAIIGNGYAHFAHLMGKAILIGAVLAGSKTITPELYADGVSRAVNSSIQELRVSYDAATQRRDDMYRHLLWALAHSDVVDLRTDDWIRVYHELAGQQSWKQEEGERLQYAIARLSQARFGSIIMNTPISYGSRVQRYRYKRFTNNLMRGHVRLHAERENVQLGGRITL